MTAQRVTIASVVEGEGELTALPVVLRRMMSDMMIWDADIQRPFLTNRSKLVKRGGLEAAVESLARRLPPTAPGGILVVIDADDDCPASLGPELLQRAQAVRPDRRTAVVLANREFEAWFLAAAPSLAGRAGLPAGIPVPDDSERPRDCKGWLSHHRNDGGSYRPRVDQPALAAAFDLSMARYNAPSFDKFCRDVNYLVTGKRE
ncbi:DUF4276 family protein [Micromonospora endophytica]|uniref:Uncharacterized protein n=1 Tax=Micromonospora endophytica TaxID=515350 RepID=A0A2W2CR83_9ACTN|nr:DUF4276 family protein [Micromonospora endophytica]PZG01153.1 hypothetical protein C1I93_00085 [Micromonospora endophytica]RIW42116.1 DUF4276 family protein [Micromonospora endophytica]BCJ61816.1 hypothetical protein Jiend_52380 [Micromonospora endophytica]